MEIDFYERLTTVDISIVIGHLIFVILLGLYFGFKHEDVEDYFQVGINLTCPLIGSSLFASNMSSNSLSGLTGSGYVTGFSVFRYEWRAVLVLIIFTICCIALFIGAKTGQSKRTKELGDTVWSAQEFGNESVALSKLLWYHSYRIHGFILVVILTVILFIY